MLCEEPVLYESTFEVPQFTLPQRPVPIEMLCEEPEPSVTLISLS